PDAWLIARRPVDGLDQRRLTREPGGIGIAREAVARRRARLVDEVAVRRVAEEPVPRELVQRDEVAHGDEKTCAALADAALAVRDRRRRLGVGEVVGRDAPGALALHAVVGDRVV